MISWTQLLKQPLNKKYNRYIVHQGPQVVVWNSTSYCNLSCRHCYFTASDTKAENELTTKEARALITDLADFGVKALLFSGGEPLLRKDIFILAHLANRKGLRTTLSTNGTLISLDLAKKIKEAGFSYVGVSLDGLKQTNDTLRRHEGAFRRSLKGIRNCQEAGIKVGLRFTLNQYNLGDLAGIFKLAEEEGVSRLCVYHLVYSGRGASLKNQDLTDKERREVLEFIWQKTKEFIKKGLGIEVLTVDNHADGAWLYLKLKKEEPHLAENALSLLKEQGGNSSGIRILAVDNFGNIFPDQFWRTHSLGNIRDRRFSEVWQDGGNTFLKTLKDRKGLLKGRCQGCSFLSICNGNFRARAEAVSKDPWAPDPACYLTKKEIRGNFN